MLKRKKPDKPDGVIGQTGSDYKTKQDKTLAEEDTNLVSNI